MKSKEQILNDLQSYKKMKKDAEFARFLGITGQNLVNWKKRNTIQYDVVMEKMPEINPFYLLNGEGEMLLSNCNNNTIVENSNNVTQSNVFGNNHNGDADSNNVIDKIIEQNTEILKQNTKLIEIIATLSSK